MACKNSENHNGNAYHFTTCFASPFNFSIWTFQSDIEIRNITAKIDRNLLKALGRELIFRDVVFDYETLVFKKSNCDANFGTKRTPAKLDLKS